VLTLQVEVDRRRALDRAERVESAHQKAHH
jgi:hypothetical protein